MKKALTWLLALCMILSCLTAFAEDLEPNPIFRNTSGEYSFRERAVDLVARMTLEEKASHMVNQMAAIPRLDLAHYNVWNEATHGHQYPVEYEGKTLGMTSLPMPIAMASSWDRDLSLSSTDVIATEVRASYNMVPPGTSYAYPGGGLTFWSPVVEGQRDPRWGRTAEAYAEDSFLTTEISKGYVDGMMKEMEYNGNTYIQAYATAKHFLANNCEAVRMRGTSTLRESELYEYYIDPYRTLLLNSNLQSVMTSYNRVNNVPTSASVTLLDQLVRKTWGMTTGYVTGDCGAVNLVGNTYQYVGPDYPDEEASGALGVALSVIAGVDNDCTGNPADYVNAVLEGYLTEDELDEALINMQEVVFSLGVYEATPWDHYGLAEIDNDAHAQVALECANETIVLLKNEGVLPLAKDAGQKIALIGPMTNIVELGQYSGSPTKMISPLQGITDKVDGLGIDVQWDEGASIYVPSSLMMLNTVGFTFASGEGQFDVQASDSNPNTRVNANFGSSASCTLVPGSSITFDGMDLSLFSGIKLSGYYLVRNGGFRLTVLADGKEIASGVMQNANSIVTFRPVECSSVTLKFDALLAGVSEHAKTIANDADVVVLFVGATTQTSAEGGDRAGGSLAFPGEQCTLIDEMLELDKPVVIVMESMNMLEIEAYKERAAAIIWYGFNGQAQGAAIANVLFGDVNPSAHLPFTWYQEVGNLSGIENYYLDSVSDNGTESGRTYMYYNGPISYPFGYGLTYTTFEYANMTIDCETFTPNDIVTVSCDVTNTGDVAGKTVVQAYVYAPDSGEAGRPLKRLRGFEKVALEAGETKRVDIAIPAKDLWYYEDPTGNSLLTEQTPNGQKNSSADLIIDGHIAYQNGIYTFEIADAASNLENNGPAANAMSLKAEMVGELKLALQAVSLEPGTIETGKKFVFNPGETVQSVATIALNNDTFLDNAEAKITYASNRTNVATVDANGLVTAVGTGVATISATIEYAGGVMVASYVLKVR